MFLLPGEDDVNARGRDGVVHKVVDAWQSQVDLHCQQGFHYWEGTLGPGALPERFVKLTDEQVTCIFCLAVAT